MIKSRRMRRAEHVTEMGRRRMHIEYWWEISRKEITMKSIRRWVDNIKIEIGEIA
jgi:hypothetical protein